MVEEMCWVVFSCGVAMGELESRAMDLETKLELKDEALKVGVVWLMGGYMGVSVCVCHHCFVPQHCVAGLHMNKPNPQQPHSSKLCSCSCQHMYLNNSSRHFPSCRHALTHALHPSQAARE